MTASSRGAWLLLAAGENRQHGGNSGYDDQPDVYYTWDSTVAHHRDLKVGDPIALWDKDRLLGCSIIEEIQESVRDKLLFKCPECGKAGIKARKQKSPRYKCYKCGHFFDKPSTRWVSVTEYRSRHDAAWRTLEDLMTGAELRALCVSAKSQQSLRPLKWSDFQAAVAERGAQRSMEVIQRRSPDFFFTSGHVLTTVRVRRGQQTFRNRLLKDQGQVCAFTGDAPKSVLEAGHLYSYANLGIHYEHGGVLLRRDIHRLFDDGALAIEPRELRVDVSPLLEPFPQYASLHGLPLRTPLRPVQEQWVAEHWKQHRSV